MVKFAELSFYNEIGDSELIQGFHLIEMGLQWLCELAFTVNAQDVEETYLDLRL